MESREAKLKMVWMAAEPARKSRYGLRTLGGIYGIAALLLVIVVGGVFLSFALGLPRELSASVLVIAAAALGVWLAVRLGRRTAGNAAVFFLTEDDRLFALDARSLFGHGHGLPGYAAGTMETQRFLRRLAERPSLPAAAEEVRRVERVRERGGVCEIRCAVRRLNGRPVRRVLFFPASVENREALLRELERRASAEGPELAAPKGGALLVVSAALLFVFLLLCVLSHPAVGALPQAVYFPCLAAAFASVVALAAGVAARRGSV